MRIPRGTGRGDTVAAEIGEHASHVVVGKNIIQIGSLNVPVWLAALTLLVVVAGVSALVFFSLRTQRDVDAARGDVQAVRGIVEATPVPSPTPTITPTPTPEPMAGDFNIAIARPQPVGSGGRSQVSDFVNWYPEQVYDKLDKDFAQYRTSLGIKPAIRIVPVRAGEGDDWDRFYADYAQEIGAHVLLYGELDTERAPNELKLRFYIHPKLRRSAPETTGSDAFGAPIEIRFAEGGEAGADQLAWKAALNTPLADLAAFMTGIALFDAGEYGFALEQFEQLHTSARWADREGKSVLYLWLGTTHFFRALDDTGRGQEPASVICLANGEEIPEDQCSQKYYELARELKPDYARAYIGLGNYWLEFGEDSNCTHFDESIKSFEAAQERTAAATAEDAQFVQTTLAAMKTSYQLGLAHARALEAGCGDLANHDSAAVDSFDQALDWYRQADEDARTSNAMLRDLASRASYMQALVHQWLGRDDLALAALDEVMAIAEPADGVGGDPWQSIRWVAWNQIGAIHLVQVEAGNFEAFRQAENALLSVARAFASAEEPFGKSFADEPLAAAAAYYHLGRLHLAVAQRNEDSIDLSALSDAELFLDEAIGVLEAMDAAVAESQGDGLNWKITVRLGDVYRLWADAGESSRYEDALLHYDSVIQALQEGRIVPGELALDLLAEALVGSGAVQAALGDDAQAVELLAEVIEMTEELLADGVEMNYAGKPNQALVQSAQELLDEITG